jgi:serine phosphatase RsbU (regulator of sigma subunit)
MIRGIAPTDGSVTLPFFGIASSPVEEGVIRTGLILLAICTATRLPLIRKWPGSAIVIGGLVLAPRLPVWPFWFAVLTGIAIAALLVRAHAMFSLTALLAAAMTSAILPAAAFSLVHVQWVPGSALVLLAFALLPIVFGAIGIRRGEEVETGPLRVSAFVRRLEEENRLKYEMDLLARMQLGLLPLDTPNVPGYEIAARSILANEAGGDLYDFLTDDEGRMWIAAGDVSGHGYSCAIAQAMTKAGLASLVEASRTPAAVLTRLDLVLRGLSTPRTFTTLVLLRLDPATGEALVSNAGHPFPLISCDGTAPRELELPSLPLGQGPPRHYADTSLSIERGMSVVLSSDGLFEATDAAGRAYGFDRVRQLLATICRRPAPAILEGILADWRAHAGAAAPADDTTLVVLRRL